MPFNRLDYSKAAKIRIHSTYIDAELTNFPIKVWLDASNFNFDDVLDSGYDIAFCDLEGNLLDFERVELDKSNEEGYFNVRIPTVSSTTDTEIMMLWDGPDVDYSNASGVWDESFVGVWHFGIFVI